MSSLPRPVITLIDQDTFAIKQYEREGLEGLTNFHAGRFTRPDLFFAVSGSRAFLWSYPDFRRIAEIEPPEGVTSFSRTSFYLNGRVGIWGCGTNMLYLLEMDRWRWEPMLDQPVVPVAPDEELYCSAYASLEDDSVCGFTANCIFFRIPRGARRADTQPADIQGPVMAWGPMAVVNKPCLHRAFGSTHVIQRFWEIDLDSGIGRDLGDSGPGGGQVNDMLWDDEQYLLFLASYGACALLAYDPMREPNFPYNPRIVCRVGHGQMRPLQLLKHGSDAWMISTSHYSHLGGALSRICLVTGKLEVYQAFLQTLAPTRMILSRTGRQELYLSTTAHADCQSAIPVEAGAKLLVFDLEHGRVAREIVPRIGALTLKLMAHAENGSGIIYLDRDAQELWLWDPDRNRVQRIGSAPPGLREIVPGPGDRGLWGTSHQGIGPILFGASCRIEPAIDPDLTRHAFDGLGKYLTWDGNTLWFTTGRELIGVVFEKG